MDTTIAFLDQVISGYITPKLINSIISDTCPCLSSCGRQQNSVLISETRETLGETQQDLSKLRNQRGNIFRTIEISKPLADEWADKEKIKKVENILYEAICCLLLELNRRAEGKTFFCYLDDIITSDGARCYGDRYEVRLTSCFFFK